MVFICNKVRAVKLPINIYITFRSFKCRQIFDAKIFFVFTLRWTTMVLNLPVECTFKEDILD